MPTQYPYPTEGWSTGMMRKTGEAIGGEANVGEAAGAMANNPVIDVMERLQKGRRKAETPMYETQLTDAEEAAFKQWKAKHAPRDSGKDYDFRGAFKAGIKPDPDTGHWPDTFKKPGHPTFSNESIYAKDRPDLAGSWQGDTYVPPGPQQVTGG